MFNFILDSSPPPFAPILVGARFQESPSGSSWRFELNDIKPGLGKIEIPSFSFRRGFSKVPPEYNELDAASLSIQIFYIANFPSAEIPPDC